jgi:chemotaxis protein CheD
MSHHVRHRNDHQEYGTGTAPNIYWDRQLNMQAAKILPGEYCITGRDLVLVTVLGSCVAACIREVFGGGNVLRNLTMTNVGSRNAEFVLKFLATERIPVLAQDLAHDYARKVYYYPDSGRVRLKMIRDMHNQTILQREREYVRRIEVQPVGGAVELF